MEQAAIDRTMTRARIIARNFFMVNLPSFLFLGTKHPYGHIIAEQAKKCNLFVLISVFCGT